MSLFQLTSLFYRCIQYKYLYLRQLFPEISFYSIFVSTLFSIVTTDIDLSHLSSVIFSNPFYFSVYPLFFSDFHHRFLFRLFSFNFFPYPSQFYKNLSSTMFHRPVFFKHSLPHINLPEEHLKDETVFFFLFKSIKKLLLNLFLLVFPFVFLKPSIFYHLVSLGFLKSFKHVQPQDKNNLKSIYSWGIV